MRDVKDKSKNKWLYLLFGIIFLVVAVVLVLVFLMQGNVSINNESGSGEYVSSVSCEGENIAYPFFEDDNSTKKIIKIIAKFDSKKLDSISLTYQMYYDSKQDIESSYVRNHIALNESFASSSLPADSLDAKFSRLDKYMQMMLYSEAKGVNGVTEKYFLLDGPSTQFSRENISKRYNEKGLDCVITN